LKPRRPLLFFLLPYGGVLLVFFAVASFNRAFIQERAESLVKEQLSASAEILKAGVRDLLEKNVPPQGILRGYAGAEEIYFMAVLDERLEILDWSSRFEGYLPFSRKDLPREEAWIIDSPAGRIYSVFKPLRTAEGKSYSLYLGISLRGLEDMLARSRRNQGFLFGILALAGLALFGGVFRLHRQSLARAEEAVVEREEKERLREISGFTAGIAHEIKNPLNSLALLNELMAKKAAPELAEHLALARDEIRKIAGIIDAFSSASKPLTLRRQSVRLAELVQGVRSSLLADAERKNVEILVDGKGDVQVEADRDLLTQALFNVVRNAVEATDRGWIRIRISRKRKGGVIQVEDTGRGIPDELAARLFEPFVSSKPQGLGVGLYLARKILTAHEGTIAAAPRPGGGAVMTLEIPGGPS